MRRTIHIGVSVAGLRQLITSGLVGYDCVEEGGKPVKSQGRALQLLDKAAREGKSALSGCDTPEPDGHCPGHPAPVEKGYDRD